jgi:hypothetical protein
MRIKSSSGTKAIQASGLALTGVKQQNSGIDARSEPSERSE